MRLGISYSISGYEYKTTDWTDKDTDRLRDYLISNGYDLDEVAIITEKWIDRFWTRLGWRGINEMDLSNIEIDVFNYIEGIICYDEGYIDIIDETFETTEVE